jgi:antitoxin component YwqK of YwqJK toxin-antitoxin module
MRAKDITPKNEKGERHGKWLYYYHTGELMEMANYVNDEPIGYYHFNWYGDMENENEYYAR